MIDWNRVAELRDEIGPEDFSEVVDLFLDEVETEIETLPTTPKNADLEAKLHFLKGSALNLGFDAFSELCKTGEISAAQGQAATVDVGAIVAAYSDSKSVFLSELETRFA